MITKENIVKLVLEQSEIEAALEAFVRTQINVPDNQTITIRPVLGDNGNIEASVYLNATSVPIPTKTAPVILQGGGLVGQPLPAARGRPRKVNPEPTVDSHIAARVAEDQAQVDETSNNDVVEEINEILALADAIINDEPLPESRSISATPEDRQPEPVTTTAAAKPFSMFSKPAAAEAPALEPAEAQVETPKPKSIFSFGAKAAV